MYKNVHELNTSAPPPGYLQVEQVDRSPPGLATKRPPSTVENLGGGSRQGIYITSRHLQASDPDSPVQELEYVITRPPHFGYLENALTGTLTLSLPTTAAAMMSTQRMKKCK